MTRDSVADLSSLDFRLFFALGVSFHVLATPEIAGVPMRVGLSDAVLGLTLLLCAWRTRGSSGIAWPDWSRRSYIWLVAAFAAMVMAYVRSGHYDDAAAVWAQIKVVGFVVLSAYFVLGNWIASGWGAPGALAVVRGFVAGAWVFSAYGLMTYTAYFYFDVGTIWGPRPAGLAENPNAYGIMLAAAFVVDAGTSATQPLFSKRLAFWGAALTLAAIFLSGSRSAYLGLLMALAGLMVFTGFSVRRIVGPAIGAAAIFASLFVIGPVVPPAVKFAAANLKLPDFTSTDRSAGGAVGRSGRAGVKRAPGSFEASKDNFAVSRELVDVGVRDRIKIYKRGAAMWWQWPWFGAGLGAFWRESLSREGFPYVNHSTALWLASEFGLLGVLLFMGGILAVTVAFIQNAADNPLARGAAGMMFVLLGASVGTEVMYQRYAWCICGLTLAVIAGDRLRSSRDPARNLSTSNSQLPKSSEPLG